MERETLLTVLIVLLGGAALQMFAHWPSVSDRTAYARQLERTTWVRLWWPLMPALMVATWLCGWALSEPDPVPDRVGLLVLVACAPFILLLGRAVMRAAWSLWRGSEGNGISTVGLIRPRIAFAPELARMLDDQEMRAALEHERAHVQHRDPLRIWVAQFVSDLQWPWPSGRRRFQAWLAALECARDEEARGAGIEGPDLAAAILASLRFRSHLSKVPCAQLTGEATALEDRVARLLRPLSQPGQESSSPIKRVILLLVPALVLALALGAVFGERLIKPLLALAS